MEEYQQVPVHGANLRYAASQLGAMGVPFQVTGQQGGVYIILVPMSYAQQVAAAPWVYQAPGRGEWIARMPWLRLAMAIILLAGVAYACQGAGVIAALAGLALNPEYRELMEEAKSTPAPASPVEQIGKEIERRTTDAGQGAGEAVASMVIGCAALPLTLTALAGAVWLGLRMYRKARRP